MDFIKGLNSNSSLASTLSYHELLMGDYRYFSSYTQQIDKVSAADIQQAAMKYLTEQNRTVAVLKKESKQPQKEMIEKDISFLSAVHKAIGHYETPYTRNGKIPYYFDANGRYESKTTLLRLLDHARKIGAFDQIAIIEEPFPEEIEDDVSDIPVRLAADESAHTTDDAIRRIEMGYGAIALKAIAKTLSMTLKIAQAAYERKVPCFCADLTVNPVLVEWNKNMAARLSTFTGLGNLGLVESNGHQTYRNWEKMKQYLLDPKAPWIEVEKGVYRTNADYFREGGGIFRESLHYETLLKR